MRVFAGALLIITAAVLGILGNPDEFGVGMLLLMALVGVLVIDGDA